MPINLNAGLDDYKGQKNFGKMLCVDFDGPIAEYGGWQGPDVFGTVVPGASETLNKLYGEDWYIVIFTTRLVTEALMHWLKVNAIPFHDINARLCKDGTFDLQHYENLYPEPKQWTYDRFWRHNPTKSSIKPLASVYIDDMNWENAGTPFTAEKWERIYRSLKERFK